MLDTLSELIANVQGSETVAHGRRTLLEFARERSRARLALLFVRDTAREQLVLLERCGGRPSRSPPANGNVEVHRSGQKGAYKTYHLPVDGLFGAALDTRGLLEIARAATDVRCLPEERVWLGAEDSVLLCAVKQGEERQGVLVLCIDTIKKAKHTSASSVPAAPDEGMLLFCASLLTAYLSPDAGRDLSRPYTPSRIPSPNIPTRKPSSNTPSGTSSDNSDGYEEKLRAAIEEERGRIARDLHDGAAQHLTHVIHTLEFVQRVLEKQPQAARREINRVTDILKESLNNLRQGITSLLPAQLEEQGQLSEALQALFSAYRLNQPTLTLTSELDDLSFLPSPLDTPTFQFVQEALNNTLKHAQATRVFVRVRIIAGVLLVVVSDNGIGFDVEDVLGRGNTRTDHLGLRTMRERVQQAGGHWEIHSKRGEGTTVKVRFTLATPSAVLTHREREVLGLLTGGLTNRAIAAKLSVSTETVKSHVHHIMQKMQVNDRTQAAVTATRGRWV